MEVVATHSCAMNELAGIRGKQPEEILLMAGEMVPQSTTYLMGERRGVFRGGHLVFTQNDGDSDKYCQRLADYIKKHKLGPVTVSPPNHNAMYGVPEKENGGHHMVTIYVWSVNHVAFKRWLAEHKK